MQLEGKKKGRKVGRKKREKGTGRKEGIRKEGRKAMISSDVQCYLESREEPGNITKKRAYSPGY